MARDMPPDERRAFLSTGTRTANLAVTRADGSPHVVPVWFVLDGDDLVFTTGNDTVKGKALRRDGRVAVCVQDDAPPFAFVAIRGIAEVVDDERQLLEWATRIGGRYMGADRAEEFGRRNAVPGELLVRVRPTHFVAIAEMSA